MKALSPAEAGAWAKLGKIKAHIEKYVFTIVHLKNPSKSITTNKSVVGGSVGCYKHKL
jgi:hypothetical protein